MDIELCLFLSTSFIFIILILKFLTKSISNHGLPPGPWKLPILGSLHHLASGSLPHRVLRDLSRKYGSIMHLHLGEISTVVISSPRLAKEIMQTHDLVFADRPTIVASEIMFYNKSDISFAPYGDYWRQMRKVCVSQLLSPQNVKSFHSIREREVLGMIDMIRSSAGRPINLSEKLFSLTSTVVCQAAFGSTPQSELLAMISEALHLMGGFDGADLFPSLEILHVRSGTRRKLKLMHQKIDNVFDKIIKERREKSMHPKAENECEGEDLLGVLLALLQSGNTGFTDTNIKAVIFQMFVAGTDTAATTIEWAMSEMLKNPKVMANAHAELREWLEGNNRNDMIEGDVKPLSYIKLVIKETLRLHPPGPLLLRQSREACEIDGYNIPRKTRILINAWAIGRDPDVWEDVERFVPERFTNSSIDYLGTNFEFIPFGAGRRMCPGISFAIAIVELALVQLLSHFNWTLPDGIMPEDLDMTETSGLASIRKNKLYAIATPYDRATC